MRGIFAIDPAAEIRHIPKAARDLSVEDQPVFILKPLSARESARIQDGAIESTVGGKGGETTMRVMSGGSALKALASGLTGWENFKTPDGTLVEFLHNNGKPHPENLDRIPSAIRRELAEVITEGAEMDEEAEKNSD